MAEAVSSREGSGTPFQDRDDRYEEMKATVEEFVEDLATKTEEVRESEKFKEWLDVQAKFHDYSYQNTMLILIQKPDATKVAGYRTWNEEFDRQVKKGETAIWIWAPLFSKKCPECGDTKKRHDEEECPLLDEGTEEDVDWREELSGFKPVPVFDVSQTEGEPLPEIDVDARDGSEETLDKVTSAADGLNIDLETVSENEWNRSADGFSRKRKVRVLERGPAATAGTILHEYGHVLANHTHDGPLPENHSRSRKEVEAESIAYVVGRHLNMNMDNSSFYLAVYDGDGEELRDSLKTITDCASRIIEELESPENSGV